MFNVQEDEKLLFSIGWLKQNLINVGDVFTYDYPVWKVTLDGKYEWFIVATDETQALDGVIDHLEERHELALFIHEPREFDTLTEEEQEACTTAGNHCHPLNCDVRCEVVYSVRS